VEVLPLLLSGIYGHFQTVRKFSFKKEYAEAHINGLKSWELRKNDRGFNIGDIIEFSVIETGFSYSRKIVYLFEGGAYGLQSGYCIMSLTNCGTTGQNTIKSK